MSTLPVFTKVDGFESERYELVVELRRLSEDVGQSLGIVLSKNLETGQCWGAVDHEVSGNSEEIGSITLSLQQFNEITGAEQVEPSIVTRERLVKELALIDPNNVLAVQQLQAQAKQLIKSCEI